MISIAGYFFLVFGLCCWIEELLWPKYERHTLDDLAYKGVGPFLVRLIQNGALIGAIIFFFKWWVNSAAL